MVLKSLLRPALLTPPNLSTLSLDGVPVLARFGVRPSLPSTEEATDKERLNNNGAMETSVPAFQTRLLPMNKPVVAKAKTLWETNSNAKFRWTDAGWVRGKVC